MAARKFVFVVTHEHYHHPDDNGCSDMVAQRPIRVYADSVPGLASAMKTARGLAQEHCRRAGTGVVKEYGTCQSPADEYRVWVDFPKGTHLHNFFADHFVWVVRKTEFLKS